jgi:alkylation response protein AidB-like acyl-CoA dehydrogenase
VNPELSAEAEEFGRIARRAFEAGDAVEAVDPRDEPEAAAALCRAAGWSALADPLPFDDDALGLVLRSWVLLGMMDKAIALTVGYVKERRQFGQALSGFQGVQFQLTEAEVERVGVEELAKHALWSGTEADALALRLAAIEAAEVVFRVCHQLHGAIGFCDETELSWLSRASQPLRREPLGRSATLAALLRA